MTDQRRDPDQKPIPDPSTTEESGAGYGNNAETGGTEAPGEDDTKSEQ